MIGYVLLFVGSIMFGWNLVPFVWTREPVANRHTALAFLGLYLIFISVYFTGVMG